MSRLLTTLFTIVGLLGSFASAQVAANPNCPNTLAIYNPNLRTQCSNATWFIIPVTKTAVQSLVPFPLLPLPTSDKTLFPSGFPAGKHPVLLSSGYVNDIRMINLQIAALKQGSISVPFVDRLKDGKTAFNYPLQNYIGGTQNNLQAVIPTLVGTAEGTNIMVATITPLDNAYAPISSNPNEFSTEVKSVIVPNPVSGPGIIPEAFDLDFITAKSPLYTKHTFHTLVNQPQILTNTMCQRNTYYFNNTFTGEVLRSGNATLVPPLAGSAPKVLGAFILVGSLPLHGPSPRHPVELSSTAYFSPTEGQQLVWSFLCSALSPSLLPLTTLLPLTPFPMNQAQGGYSASGENVGYNAETCASAAAKLDKSALI
ncbi:hypothetical protein G7Y79_00006g018580 [Physcia stellaris]|nr:hypothetical protein G7Y79_00006g018580 [Physcia stellaris]